MKIGITGSNGFIGKRLCQRLKSEGHKVVEYDFDIRKKVKIADDVEVVYHLAAINKPYLSKINPKETFEVNVLGTLNVLEAIKDSNVKKIIFTSSILVYKDLEKTKETDLTGYNIYPYGIEKIIGEEYIKIYFDLFGIDYCILRISGAYGPGMYKNPIFDIIQGFINDKIKLYVNKNSIYNFIYIDDVVDGLINSLNWKNDIFNLCSDENIKIINIYNLLSEELKRDIKIEDEELLVKIIGNNKKIREKGWKINYSLKKGLINTYEQRMVKSI